MQQRKYFFWLLFSLVLLMLTLIAALVNLTTGEIQFSLRQLPAILSAPGSIEYSILTNLRLPRVMLAFAVGGALSLSGAILQGIYRNPLVEPYTMGISGGAVLGVSVVIAFGLPAALGYFVVPMAGFGGALLTIFVVYALSMRSGHSDINRMLLIGVMISFISASATMFLMSLVSADDLHTIIFWTMGSLDEPNTSLIIFVLALALTGLLVSWFFARPLNALRLGETKAFHLGVNTNVAIRLLFVLASLLTGTCVAVAGVIGFVGLVIPHIVRSLIGNDYRILLVSSFFGGSLFLLTCDIVARTLLLPNELPVGVVTGLIGGVTFIFVLRRSRSSFKKA